MSTSIVKKIKKSLLINLFVVAGFVATFIMSIFANLIFGDLSDEIMNYNPAVNGFIHADPSHLAYNLIMLFGVMLFAVNQSYTFKEFYKITLIISLISFPMYFFTGIPAIGISGTLYFMMTRACVNSKSIIIYILLGGGILYEFFHVMEIKDGVAHYVHVIGCILGYISLKNHKYLGIETQIPLKIKNQVC